jgi:glutamyl-Q tRNA(Asp) synthetase
VTLVVGRFAPSPTGPLHLGSLVAAIGSYVFAKRDNGQWLVRMEDLDTPRIVPGSADEILAALQRYGLQWDGEVVFQSQRIALYESALQQLREKDLVYDCACSRADLQRAASAPLGAEPVYPGTCRAGLNGRAARAVRFRAPDETIAQGVTQVVRGGDLLLSTPRQIALQRALGLPTPQYAHLPLVTNADGTKLGKRDGALPLPALDEQRVTETLAQALAILNYDADSFRAFARIP